MSRVKELKEEGLTPADYDEYGDVPGTSPDAEPEADAGRPNESDEGRTDPGA